MGSEQQLPPIYRAVVLKIEAPTEEEMKARNQHGILPRGIAVGYLKYAAGDHNCPYFVIPQFGGKVIAWCDCLPESFDTTKEWRK